GVLLIAEGVARDGFLGADDTNNVASVGHRQLLVADTGVGMDTVQLAGKLLDLAAGVPDTAVGLELAGVNAHEEHVAVFRRDDLEDQARERRFRIALAYFFLVLLVRIDPFYRRDFCGRGQIPDDAVKQWLDADMFAAGASQHRLDLERQR